MGCDIHLRVEIRPETGPMEFDNDWRGIFIRGDSAIMGFLPSLIMVKDRLGNNDTMLKYQIQSMIDLFKRAHHQVPDDDLQKMKSFSKCKMLSLSVVE